jgi:hypothetical protein
VWWRVSAPAQPTGSVSNEKQFLMGAHMARTASRTEFVSMVAQEVSSGIDQALQYWLGRIELEVVDRSLTTAERISAIEQILTEYKIRTGKAELGCASA